MEGVWSNTVFGENWGGRRNKIWVVVVISKYQEQHKRESEGGKYKMQYRVSLTGYQLSNFAGNLWAKNQQGTEKSIQHNGRTVFSRI